MELPRPVSRVGEFIGEHSRLALVSAIVLPLGALAAKVLRSRPHVAEMMASNQKTSENSDTPNKPYGDRWHILEEDDPLLQ